MKQTDQIIRRAAEDLGPLDDGSVALTVTSPPYWNAIDYDIHTRDASQWYRTRSYGQGYEDYQGYLRWLSGVFSPLLTKTKAGGFCAVVIGTVLLDGKHYPLPFDFTAGMVQWGWEFHQDIIWNKVTGGVRRAGVFIQKPFPGYYYPNIMTEYILVFRRPGPPIYEGRSDEERERARIELDEVFKKDVANTVWHIAPVPPGHLDHPCPFPEEIPYRLIRLYSYPGDLVFDPFVGSGQTTKVAHYLDRRYLGFDTEAKYVAYARRRAKHPARLRKTQLVPSFANRIRSGGANAAS